MGYGGYDMNQYNIGADSCVPQRESWTCQIDSQVNDIISHTNELVNRLTRLNEKLLGGDKMLRTKEVQVTDSKPPIGEELDDTSGMIEKILCNCKRQYARLADMEYEIGRLEQL